jgi:xanthine/uracil permease
MTQSGRPSLKNALGTPRATPAKAPRPKPYARLNLILALSVTFLMVVAAHLTNPGLTERRLCSAIILGYVLCGAP